MEESAPKPSAWVTTKDSVKKAVRRATGEDFRDEFRAFTDAVAVAVSGVHGDVTKLQAWAATVDRKVAERNRTDLLLWILAGAGFLMGGAALWLTL